MNKTIDYAASATDEAIATTKAALEAHGFAVTVVDNLDTAKTTVLDMIPQGAEVMTMTSATLDKTGIAAAINESGNYVPARAAFFDLMGQPDKAKDMKRIGSVQDYAVGSVHALTQDGQVLIASATGSQLPAYVYGASNVVWVVGAQKIVENLDQAFDRLETHTFPLEDARSLVAYGVHSSINKVLVYRNEVPGRIRIVIIKEAVGF